MKKNRDVLELDYNEAWILMFMAEAFLEDHGPLGEKDLGQQFISLKSVAFGKRAVDKLKTFTDIGKRCGVTGPPNSSGDYPSCTLLPHAGDRHSALDEKIMKLQRWRGEADYVGDFISEARKDPNVTITISKKKSKKEERIQST